MVMEEAVPPISPLVTSTDFDDDSSTTEDSSIVVLGKGNVLFSFHFSQFTIFLVEPFIIDTSEKPGVLFVCLSL